MLTLPDFQLEVYFSRWEFAARHHLTASDAETLTLDELLALGSAADREAFGRLGLGYVPTWGGDDLRQAIAATYEGLAPEDVLTYAGAEEALFWLMLECAGPGDHVLLTVPNYQSMESVAAASGAEVGGLLLDPDRGWALDLDAVRAALRPNTRFIGVNFPNNPTGAVPSREVFQGLVDLCEARGIRLFCDEVHRGLELDPADRLPQAADLSPTAVSLNVLSKSYGMPGLRIGWLATRDRALLSRLERRKHFTSICNAAPSEFLATLALRHGEALQARNRAIVAANLPKFEAVFGGRPDLFAWERPRGGCVCFPRYLGPEGAEAFCQGVLEREGVLFAPAACFRSELAPVPMDRFRVGLGRKDPEAGLAGLVRYLEGRKG